MFLNSKVLLLIMAKFWVVLGLFLVGSLVRPVDCLAEVLFRDDFSNIDESKWYYYGQGGTIDYNAGLLKLSSVSELFPYVLGKDVLLPFDRDYVVEVKFRYSYVGFMGDGIGIGFTGARNNFNQFTVWNDRTNGSLLISNNFATPSQGGCSNFTIANDLVGRTYTPMVLGNDWHVLRIEKTGSSFEIYIDKDSG